MPSTPLRKPVNDATAAMLDEKPHKKLIRTLSYRQARRSLSEAEFALDSNLNFVKPISNSARSLHCASQNDEVQVPKIDKLDNLTFGRRKKEPKKSQRPMSLDLDAVARVLNADWSDDFKVALFHSNDEDLLTISETADSDGKKSAFKRSFKRKNFRKLALHPITPTSADSLKSPSIGGYIRDSWDSLLTKMTEKHSSDLRK